MDSSNSSKKGLAWERGFRPLCPCCGGGEYRKGYTKTKAASRRSNKKARKPRYKDHR